MYPLFVILIVIAAVLMIAIVLIQESKGGGLSSGFSSGNQIMGVRKTTDFVEKTTWALAAFMVVVSVACAYTAPQAVAESDALKGMATPAQQKTAPTTVPGFGASEQAAPAADAKADAPAADAKADAPAADVKAEAPAADAPAAEPAAPAEEKK